MQHEHWAQAELGDVVDRLIAGVSVNSEDRVRQGNEIGVLKTSALSRGIFDASQHKTVLRRERRRVATPVESDTILVSRMNTLGLVGESAYVSKGDPNLFLPDRIWQLYFKDKASISVRWLGYVLASASAKAYIKLNSTGTSGSMKNLPQSRLLRLPLSIPPLPEQCRIAEILDTLDDAIRKTEQVVAKLQQMKQGLLHDLLTRGIDENGELRDPQRHPEQFKDSPLGRIPRGWGVGSLQAYLKTAPKNGYSPVAIDHWSGVMMLGLGCLTSSGFRPRQLKHAPLNDQSIKQALLSHGDLLMSRSNTRELVGLSGLYEDIGVPCIYPDLMMKLVPNMHTTGQFLEVLLLSPNMRRQIQAVASGTSGSMVKINAEKVLRLTVPMPSLDEQQRILTTLFRTKQHIESESCQASKLLTLKQGLMDDLLTGRVRVPVESEVAAA